MSDISIPGASNTNRLDTEKVIEDLMQAERIPLDRMENDLTELEKERSAWQGVNRRLASVREKARVLFGFENPFNERVAESSNETVLTAVPTREAEETTAEITVERVASRDRFLSDRLSTDFEVPSGTYGFSVGDQEIRFAFKGGSLSDLSRLINRRAEGIVSSRVVNDTPSSQVMLIEAVEAGSDHKLQFLETAQELGVSAGLIKPSDTAARNIKPAPGTVRQWEKPLTEETVLIEDGVMSVTPSGEAAVPISPPVQTRENLVLEITLEIETIPYDYTPPDPPPGPDTPEAADLSFQGISLENAPSTVVAPEWQPPDPPAKQDDLNVLFVQGDGRTRPLPPVADQEAEQVITVPIADYANVLTSVNVRNNNTHRTINVTEIRVYDPSSRGDYSPVNPLETAEDAVLRIDGIRVTRAGNQIDDLIPGVTLSLHDESDEPVELTIRPDTEAVKESIIEFVGLYNRLIADVNIYTARNTEIIEELTYLTDEEREAATESMGLLQGDTLLMQLKSRLQYILMNPYSTSAGRSITLLDQIGVSTNATRSVGAAYDRSRLRGYLEIEESRLDAALENHLPAVKELFGKDSDGDMITDTGVAYTVDAYIRPYVGTGSILSNRLSNIDRQIGSTTREIETFEEKLARKEQEYRQKYNAMEGAMNALEQSSDQIDNLNSGLNNE